MLRGEAPYRDAWDFKPPGIYFVYALARGVLGPSMASVRMLEVVWLVSLLPGLRDYCRAASPAGRCPGCWASRWPRAVTSGSATGTPRSRRASAACCSPGRCVLATAAPASARPRDLALRRGGRALRAGGADEAAARRRDPGLRGLRRARRLARRGAAGAAARDAARLARSRAAAPRRSCSSLAWFAAQGALPALADALFGFAPAYTRLNYQPGSLRVFPFRSVEFLLFRFSLLHPVGLALLFALPRARAARARGTCCTCSACVCFAVLGVALQGRFFAYHYGPRCRWWRCSPAGACGSSRASGGRYALGPALARRADPAARQRERPGQPDPRRLPDARAQLRRPAARATRRCDGRRAGWPRTPARTSASTCGASSRCSTSSPGAGPPAATSTTRRSARPGRATPAQRRADGRAARRAAGRDPGRARRPAPGHRRQRRRQRRRRSSASRRCASSSRMATRRRRASSASRSICGRSVAAPPPTELSASARYGTEPRSSGSSGRAAQPRGAQQLAAAGAAGRRRAGRASPGSPTRASRRARCGAPASR